MEVIHLRYGKSPGEIALVWPSLGAAFISDLVWGGPSGVFSFLPDEKLADPARAALELRKLLAYPRVTTILVGDGHSIFGNAREKLARVPGGAGRHLVQLVAGTSSIHGSSGSGAASGWRRRASWTMPSATRGAGREK